MTLTLQLDDDLAQRLEQEASQVGEPPSETAKRLLRSGLRRVPAQAPFPPSKGAEADNINLPGAKHLGLPPQWTSGKIEDLLDILEGSDRPC